MEILFYLNNYTFLKLNNNYYGSYVSLAVCSWVLSGGCIPNEKWCWIVVTYGHVMPNLIWVVLIETVQCCTIERAVIEIFYIKHDLLSIFRIYLLLSYQFYHVFTENYPWFLRNAWHFGDHSVLNVSFIINFLVSSSELTLNLKTSIY